MFIKRRKTRQIRVGGVPIGGGAPIVVQSMTTPDTADIAATVAQIRELEEVGCEIVRVTVNTPQAAAALPAIKSQMKIPLIADIHFDHRLALQAAEVVDCVRINPGNYADSKKFAIKEYTDDQYTAELKRIEEKFTPLVLLCKQLGRAMRIGTNHGSLYEKFVRSICSNSSIE